MIGKMKTAWVAISVTMARLGVSFKTKPVLDSARALFFFFRCALGPWRQRPDSDDERNKRQSVCKKCRGFAQPIDQITADSWAEHARTVENRAVDRDAVLNFGTSDQFGYQRGLCWHFKGI